MPAWAWVTLGLLAWAVISVPLGILVCKAIRRANEWEDTE